MNPDEIPQGQPAEPATPSVPETSPEPQQAQQPTPPTSQPPQPKVRNPLSVMQAGENVICQIDRHPIGLVGTYAMFGFFLIVLALAAFILVPMAADNSSYTRGQILSLSSLTYMIIAAFIVIFMYVSVKVYKGNRWIVTSDSITQVAQTSLFDKQSSQLSLANLEDITAVQDGVMAHMFNYGTLKAETAGAVRSKFRLMYCPNPYYYAKQILDAREKFQQYRSELNERGDHPTVDINTKDLAEAIAEAEDRNQSQNQTQA